MMRNSLKRALALLFVLCLLAPAVPASSSGEEQMELTFWCYSLDKFDPASSEVVKQMEQRFNVKMNFLPRTYETWAEQVRLRISSGDVPDYFNDLTFVDYDKFVEQGVCAEIPEALVAQKAPKLSAWLKQHLGEDPYAMFKRDGKNYSIPIIWTPGSNGLGVYYRQDWLDKLGIAKAPETIEEYEAMLTKFRNDDPDGNGVKDTYGFTASGFSNASGTSTDFGWVFGAFGAFPMAFTEGADGKLVRGEVSPQAKAALEVLHRWYENELIDPEFITNKQDNVKEKWIAEKCGMGQAFWWEYLPQQAFFDGFFYEQLKEKNPAAVVSPGTMPVGPDGSSGTVQSNPIVSSGLLFGKHMEAQPEKMAKYIEIAEATSFDPELLRLWQKGIEGVSYEVKDGVYEWLPPYGDENERNKLGLGIIEVPGCFNDYELLGEYYTQPQYQDVKAAAEAKCVGKYDIMLPVSMDAYNEYQDALKNLTDKNMIDFITGARPLDQFDAFVAEWMAAGGEQVMAEAQAKYDAIGA